MYPMETAHQALLERRAIQQPEMKEEKYRQGMQRLLESQQEIPEQTSLKMEISI